MPVETRAACLSRAHDDGVSSGPPRSDPRYPGRISILAGSLSARGAATSIPAMWWVDQCPSIPSCACLPQTCCTRESRPQENR